MLRRICILMVCLAFLAGCVPTRVPPTPTPSPMPTLARPTATATLKPATVTPSPSPTTPALTATPAPNITFLNTDATAYHDDRSSAVSLLTALYNAINRHEYLRAYSYWEPEGQISGTTFSAYQAGFSDTDTVQLAIGDVTQGAAAGNIYYSAVVSVTAHSTAGAVQQYVGCYLLHLGSPANQGVPPFRGLAITKGSLKVVPSGIDPFSLLATACTDASIEVGQPIAVVPTPDPADIGAARYLDDRSDALQVMRSYFNAVNRREYVRAYSYWNSRAAITALPPFDQFASGYSDTAAVQLMVGPVHSDAGAGQLYYSVPVVLIATSVGGVSQSYAGCYQLHLSQPGIQGAPPFEPLAIISATISTVAAGDDPAAQAIASCQ